MKLRNPIAHHKAIGCGEHGYAHDLADLGWMIVRETKVEREFVYYHVELDDHSLILAENTPAETFVDNVDRLGFDNWAAHQALYPDGKTVEEMPFPRAKARRQVPMGIQAAIEERANAVCAQETLAVA